MEPLESVIFWGLVGALLAEGVVWYRIKAARRLPYSSKFGEKRYCAQALIWIAAGPLINIAHLESGNVILPWLALHIGATAPIIMGALMSRIPDIAE